MEERAATPLPLLPPPDYDGRMAWAFYGAIAVVLSDVIYYKIWGHL